MESLFWGSASADLKLIIFFLFVFLFISLLLYIIKRKLSLSVIIFSVLANILFFLNNGSDIFDYYNIVWLLYFSVFIWPILNILLIIWYFKTKPKK